MCSSFSLLPLAGLQPGSPPPELLPASNSSASSTTTSVMGQDDDLCGLCIKESHTEYFPSAATAHRFYDQREVVRIGESVHNLVQHGITKQTAIVLNYPGFTFKSDPAAYDDYRRRPGLLTKARKVTGPDDDDVLSRVILFATFDGCVPLRTDLPKVLQWFSIPVMPHVAVLTGTERTHIHTTPEWSNSSKSSEPINAWVIAREYLSRGYIDCWWRNENRTRPGSSFKVDWDVWADINEAMDCLWDTWLDKCRESRGVLEEYQREYLVSSVICLSYFRNQRMNAHLPGVCRDTGEEARSGEQLSWFFPCRNPETMIEIFDRYGSARLRRPALPRNPRKRSNTGQFKYVRE